LRPLIRKTQCLWKSAHLAESEHIERPEPLVVIVPMRSVHIVDVGNEQVSLSRQRR
jgi:hypothetical protein